MSAHPDFSRAGPIAYRHPDLNTVVTGMVLCRAHTNSFWLTRVIHKTTGVDGAAVEPSGDSLRRFAGLNLLSPKRFTREKSFV